MHRLGKMFVVSQHMKWVAFQEVAIERYTASSSLSKVL